MKRGQVYYADLNPVIGSEQGGIRPCVIIQNDRGNTYSPTTIVAPMTTKNKNNIPIHIKVSENDKKLKIGTNILVEQIRVIDKTRIKRFVCELSKETMDKVNKAIETSLGLNKKRGGIKLNELLEPKLKIKPIKWKNQVVITTALLAEVYETSVDNVKMNFNRNKGNFIEGKHYFLLKGEELKTFKNKVTDSYLVHKRTSHLYLWTERGANRHCKILDTDKAWEQFDNLEETYFNAKQSIVHLDQLDPQTRLMNLLVQSISRQELEQKRQSEQLNRIEKKQESIIDTFQKMDDTESFQKWANNCITKIAESPKFNKEKGGNQKYSLARSESYDRLKQKRRCRLNDRVQKAIGRALKEKPDIKKNELQKINKIYVIANDKDLRPVYELVIKEMMIYYCAT